MTVVYFEIGRLFFVVGKTVGNYLEAGGATERRCLYFSSTPPCSVLHLSESWYGRVRKHWVSEEKNAVGIKDTLLCKVECKVIAF